jgi:hypothetical protein
MQARIEPRVVKALADVAAGRDQDPLIRRGDVVEPLHGGPLLLRARHRTEWTDDEGVGVGSNPAEDALAIDCIRRCCPLPPSSSGNVTSREIGGRPDP